MHLSDEIDLTNQPSPTPFTGLSEGDMVLDPFGETTNPKPFGETTNPKPFGETTNLKPFGETTNPKPFGETTNPKSFGETTDSSRPFGETTIPNPFGEIIDPLKPLTFAEFEYTIKIVNSKIDTVYRLCRIVADQQQESLKSLKKLVAFDRLSDGFWKVFIFELFQVKINIKPLLFCAGCIQRNCQRTSSYKLVSHPPRVSPGTRKVLGRTCRRLHRYYRQTYLDFPLH
jgi:hypothetical protein